ncbi:MAG: hypothetical protein FJ302_06650 [Planctomycetes bacterium]|nr:hypothetical protein [Planctomycetota bacterium]
MAPEGTDDTGRLGECRTVAGVAEEMRHDCEECDSGLLEIADESVGLIDDPDVMACELAEMGGALQETAAES